VAADIVLVTGASGFVGAAVVRALLASGYRVRALRRPSSPSANLDGLDVELREGDLRDPASLAAAMAGARDLVHVAADYRLWARDPEELIRTNRDGTGHVMRAAQAAGIERIVYTSSVATLAYANGIPSDETRRLPEAAAIGAYKRSKIAAETLVEQMIACEALPAVIVHPSTPLGPRDIRPTPTGRIVIEAAMGRIPGYVDTGLNLVHVDDVARGHVMALERGKPGAHYILGGQNVPFAALLAAIAEISGHARPRFRIPRPVLYPLAAAAEAMARVTGHEPFVTFDGLRMSKHMMFFSSAKAEQDLGYTARPYEAALADGIAWFRDNGYLK
jgi:dihydroflavonol-4-reductase